MAWRYTAGLRSINRVTGYQRNGHPMVYVEWVHNGRRRRRSSVRLLGYPVADEEQGRELVDWVAANIEHLRPPHPDLGAMFQQRGDEKIAVTDGRVCVHPRDVAEMRVADLVAPTVDVTPLSGVYLLLFRGSIVYVGRTTDLWQRVKAHSLHSPFRFDDVAFHEMGVDDAVNVERRLIERLQPMGNSQFTARARRALSSSG